MAIAKGVFNTNSLYHGGGKMVKGPAQARILSMNLTRGLSKSPWRGLPNTF